MDYFDIACQLDCILELVGLEEFRCDLWSCDVGLTYAEITDLSLWALVGPPAEEDEKP